MWAMTCTGKTVVRSVTRSARPAAANASRRAWASDSITGWSASIALAVKIDEIRARWRVCSFPSISMIVRPMNLPTSALARDEYVSPSRSTDQTSS
jgi:hypothetical protein